MTSWSLSPCLLWVFIYPLSHTHLSKRLRRCGLSFSRRHLWKLVSIFSLSHRSWLTDNQPLSMDLKRQPPLFFVLCWSCSKSNSSCRGYHCVKNLQQKFWLKKMAFSTQKWCFSTSSCRLHYLLCLCRVHPVRPWSVRPLFLLKSGSLGDSGITVHVHRTHQWDAQFFSSKT